MRSQQRQGVADSEGAECLERGDADVGGRVVLGQADEHIGCAAGRVCSSNPRTAK